MSSSASGTDLREHLNRLGRVLTLTSSAAMLVAGVLLGFIPLEVEGAGCGSAFVAGDDFTSPIACSQLRSLMLPLALSALGGAVVFGLATLAFAPSVLEPTDESSPGPDTTA